MASAVYCNTAYDREKKEDEVYEEVGDAANANDHHIYRCPERAQKTCSQEPLASKPANSGRCVFLLTTLTILALLSAAAAITVAVIQVSSMKKELTEIREQYSTDSPPSVNFSQIFEALDDLNQERFKGIAMNLENISSQVELLSDTPPSANLSQIFEALDQNQKRLEGIDMVLENISSQVDLLSDLGSNGCEQRVTSGAAFINSATSPERIKVWCDLDTPDGPWIVFLKRFDGSVDFRRNLTDYKSRFGDIGGEYWLGLDNLHALTMDHGAMLRIDVTAYSAPSGKGLTAFALYDTFIVGDASSDYTLELDGYSGNAGDVPRDGVLALNGQKFSTIDRDLDLSSRSCAAINGGGWWFGACYHVCLTCGPWRSSAEHISDAIVHYPFAGLVALKAAEMKLKLT